MTPEDAEILLNKIHCGDCLDYLTCMEDGCVDLVVTSPPYDGARKYNGYSFDFEGIARQLFRVMKVGGVVVWVVNDQTIKGSESGTSFRQALYFKEIGFNLFDTMIWNKLSPSSPTQDRYYSVFEYMFILSKGAPKTLNLIADRSNKTFGQTRNKETRSCKENRSSVGTRSIPEFSRRFNVWEIDSEKRSINHPAVFPERLAHDHIISWSNEGDIVLDIFSGSGTTCKMAKLLKRNFIGIDVSQQYVDESMKRIFG